MNVVYYFAGDPLQHRLVAVAAAAAGDLETVERLLGEGAPPSTPDTCWGATLLHVAGAAGHLNVVNRFIKGGAILDIRDGDGITPLMAACSAGRNEVALTLANIGADVPYERPEDGMSALKFALWGRCSRKVIRCLLSKGASEPEPGFVIVHLAAPNSGNWQVAKFWATRAFVVVGLCAMIFVIIIVRSNAP